jgi:hypothetical protein
MLFQQNEYDELLVVNSTQEPAMKSKGHGLVALVLVVLACCSFLAGRYSSTFHLSAALMEEMYV